MQLLTLTEVFAKKIVTKEGVVGVTQFLYFYELIFVMKVKVSRENTTMNKIMKCYWLLNLLKTRYFMAFFSQS